MEFRFARPIKRMWRADFAVIRRRILIEVEGGTTPFRDRRTGELRVGGHSTIEGYAKDCLKYNAATLLGYRVLRFTSAQVFDGTALETITQALNTFPAEEMPATVSEAAKPRPKRTRRPRQRSQPPAELAAAAPTRTA